MARSLNEIKAAQAVLRLRKTVDAMTRDTDWLYQTNSLDLCVVSREAEEALQKIGILDNPGAIAELMKSVYPDWHQH